MSQTGDILLYCIKFDYRLLLVTLIITFQTWQPLLTIHMLNNLETLRVTSCRATQSVENLDYTFNFYTHTSIIRIILINLQ